MGRPRKTESQRRAERFGELYRIGKARLGFTEKQIAQAIGTSTDPLRKHRKNPDTFSVGQMISLGKIFGWSDEEILSIYRPQK